MNTDLKMETETQNKYLVGDGGSSVEALCSDSSQKLPWITTSISVIGISSNQDARFSSLIGLTVDGIFLAEGFHQVSVMIFCADPSSL